MNTALAPVSGVAKNPMLGMRATDMQIVRVGQTLNDLAPDAQGGLLVVRLNGDNVYVPRTHWDYEIQYGDIVQWEIHYGNKDILRPLLQIALVVLSFFYPALAPYILAIGSLAINVLLPLTQASRVDQESASPTYSTSLNGNSARLYDVVPKVCGYHRVVPPFAAQPYVEYDANGDQFYYALFAIGVGDHDIKQELIDDTPLSNFQDVLVPNSTRSGYLPPGTLPGAVKANVVTAPEVSNFDMQTAVIIGGFAACGPKKIAEAIGIDVIAPRGLAHQEDDGSMTALTIQFRVDFRYIDDFGAPTSTWQEIATETKSAASTKVQRWSFKYSLPGSPSAGGRVEVRLVRLDVRSDNARDMHDAAWVGLRAYLQGTPQLNPYVAHYEIVLRASEQLSQLTQRSVSFMVQGKTYTWNPSGSPTWNGPVATRNPAWWLLDLASDPIWGLGLADEFIDFQSFYELSLLWDQRQDRFDFVFDTTMDGWDALQTIARAGRARCFRRNGILTIARDGYDTLPVTALTPHNTIPNSMVMNESLPSYNEPNGVILEYFDNRTWQWTTIDCPVPGLNSGGSPTDISNPVRMRLPGITGATHAKREGVYEAARMLYRRRTMAGTTEMQGVLPSYMSLLRWMPEINDYGQSGDVVYFNAGTNTVTLTEPLVLDISGDNYMSFIRDDGSLTTAVQVTAGATPYQAILPSAPDFTMVVDDGTREKPKFMFGSQTTSDELVKVVAISDGGEGESGVQLIKIQAVIDDPRVHEADNYLLPVGSEIQDPIGEGGGDEDTNIAFPRLLDKYLGYAFPCQTVGYLLNANGTLQTAEGALSAPFSNEWLSIAPVSFGSDYEARVSLVLGSLASGSSSVGVWLPMTANYSWWFTSFSTSAEYGQLYVEIRDVLSSTLQAFCNVYTQVIGSGVVDDSADDAGTDDDGTDSDSSDDDDDDDGSGAGSSDTEGL